MKKYLGREAESKYYTIDDTAKYVFTWDAGNNTIKFEYGGTNFFPGTYQSWETFSSCDYAKLQDDFVCHLYSK